MAREERRLEGQHENALDAELAAVLDQAVDDQAADASALGLAINGDGADLAEVLPEDMERAAADDLVVVDGDPELLDVFVQRDGFLHEQDLAGVLVDERTDCPDITRGRAADGELAGHGWRVPKVGIGPTRIRRPAD